MLPLHRRFLALCTAIPLLFALSVALFFNEPIGWIAAIAVLSGTLFLLASTWIFTSQASRLYQLTTLLQAELALHDEEKEALIDPFQKFTSKQFQNNLSFDLIRDVCERLAKRRDQIRLSINTLASNLKVMADPTAKIPSSPTISIPDPNVAKLLDSAYRNVSSHLDIVRQREAAFACFLRDMPTPLLVTDRSFRVISVNAAAEKFFGMPSKQISKFTLNQLLIEPSLLPASNDPLEPESLKAISAIGNLKRSPQGEVLAVAKNASGKPARVSLRAYFGKYILVNLRDVTQLFEKEQKARQQHRRWTVAQTAQFLCEEVSAPIEQAKSQARILSSIVKRGPQSAQALPSLLSNIQELDRLTITNLLLVWLVRAESQNLALGEPEEMKLAEVADIVTARFKAMLEESEAELEVIDQGAWIFSDQEYVEAVLTGILYHAVQASKNGKVKLYLKRSDQRLEDSTSFVCTFETCELSQQFLEDSKNPYQRHDSGLLKHDQSGSVLGLYVAKLLVEKLGGSLDCENLLSGLCKIVATLPSRAEMPQTSENSWFSAADPTQATVGEFMFGGERVVEGEAILAELSDDLSDSGEDTSIDMSLTETAIVSDSLGTWRFGE